MTGAQWLTVLTRPGAIFPSRRTHKIYSFSSPFEDTIPHKILMDEYKRSQQHSLRILALHALKVSWLCSYPTFLNVKPLLNQRLFKGSTFSNYLYFGLELPLPITFWSVLLNSFFLHSTNFLSRTLSGICNYKYFESVPWSFRIFNEII